MSSSETQTMDDAFFVLQKEKYAAQVKPTLSGSKDHYWKIRRKEACFFFSSVLHELLHYVLKLKGTVLSTFLSYSIEILTHPGCFAVTPWILNASTEMFSAFSLQMLIRYKWVFFNFGITVPLTSEGFSLADGCSWPNANQRGWNVETEK